MEDKTQKVLEVTLSLLASGQYDQARDHVRDVGSRLPPQEARDLHLAFAEQLFRDKNVGHAADIIADVAEILERDGATEDAANVLLDFAERLFQNKHFGWSGSRYYSAAMIHIAHGHLDKAYDILVRALSEERFGTTEQQPFSTWLPGHVKILSGRGEPTAKIKALLEDFERENRFDWMDRCLKGIRVLGGGSQPPRKAGSVRPPAS